VDRLPLAGGWIAPPKSSHGAYGNLPPPSWTSAPFWVTFGLIEETGVTALGRAGRHPRAGGARDQPRRLFPRLADDLRQAPVGRAQVRAQLPQPGDRTISLTGAPPATAASFCSSSCLCPRSA
jgi:hypothetical protein